MEVQSYVDAYNTVKAEVGSDEIAAVILDQVGKDGRVRAMNGGSRDSQARRVAVDTDGSATDKQKSYLKQLGVSFEKSISKQEASELIDAALA